MSMSEYIDKHVAYNLLKDEADSHMLPASHEAYERAAQIIDQIKPIYAEWVFMMQNNGYLWKCSLCNANFENRFNYCPYCGAKMYG